MGEAHPSDADRRDPSHVAEPRVVFDGCTLHPRVVVSSGELIVASAAHDPVQLELRRRQAVRPLVAASADAPPRVIRLPVIGHEVAVALRPDSLYTLNVGSETATIVAAPTPYYAITDANGHAVLRDVPAGTFGVAALIPERSGQPARAAVGVVTVIGDTLTPVTLAVAPP